MISTSIFQQLLSSGLPADLRAGVEQLRDERAAELRTLDADLAGRVQALEAPPGAGRGHPGPP